jgi:hypothetical protein
VSNLHASLTFGEEVTGVGDRHLEHFTYVLATELVLEHCSLEPLALAHLAGRGDGVHEAQLGVDDAGAVAVRACTVGVGAEQPRLHTVGLGERLPYRVEHPGVGRRVAAPRPANLGLVHQDDTRPLRYRTLDERALSRPGDAGYDDEHSERDVDVHILEVVLICISNLEAPGRGSER